jgi:hypothetical protein
MATDIKVVKTVFVVDTADVKKATQDYNNLANSIDKTGKELTETGKQASEGSKKVKEGLDNSKQSVDKFKSSFDGIGNAIAGAFAIGSIISFGKTVIDITSQVQKYRAVLTNTLGSQNLADIAMSQISDVAIKTNFSVMELTDTYIKFANRGLKLSQNEMMKLADIANSTGKSIDQLTEATLDAFTGENERLKEFGITAKKTGETTQYTFKGVTTEVKNTQEAIKGYLLSLGDLEGVTGSTAAISETLGGQISNLGDKWDKFLIAIGSRTSKIFGDAIGFISDRITFLEEILKSKEQEISESTIASNSFAQKSITSYFDNVKKESEKSKSDEKTAMEKAYLDKLAVYNKDYNSAKENIEDISGVKLSNIESANKALLSLAQKGASEEKKLAILEAQEYLKERKFRQDELKRQYEEYLKSKEITTKKQTDKERKAQEALDKKIVDDAINLLKHEEQIAKQKAINAGANETDILRIEDDFNYKRVEIYTKYSDILNTKQKQDQENTILNIDTLAVKISESDKKILEGRIKANEEWSKKVNDQHLKEEDNLKKTLDRQNSIEQDKIGIERAETLIKLYESNNLTIEEKLKEREKIEAEFAKQSLEETIRADEEKLLLLTLNNEDYISLERKIAEEKVKLNDEANNKIIESDKKKEATRKEIAKETIDVLKQGLNAIFQYQSNVNSATLIDLQDKEERELKLAEGNQAKKDAIAKKYAAEEAKIKRKQFEQDKAIALINIAISTAEGVAKAFAKTGPGGFALGALIIASGAIQAGLVASQPTPKFAKGVIDLQGKGTGTSDEIHAMLSKGESVMTAEETSKFKPLLQSIRRKELSPELANMMLSGQRISNVNLNTDSLAKELRGMPKNHISLDKEGFKTYLYSENLKQESLNNRYLS